MANINKIRLSGQTYDIQDPNASKTVELTQAQYDALTVKDPNTFYIITDAQGADLSQYYTSAQTESAITQAVSGKVDTSTFNTYSGSVDTALSGKVDTSSVVTAVTSASTDNEIPTAKAVYDAIPTGGTGGGKAIEAGRGISVTTGETADTVSFNLPISAGTGNNSILMSEGSVASGSKSIAGGQGCSATKEGAIALGQISQATAQWAVAIGNLCQAHGKYSTVFGSSNQCYGEGNFVEGYNNKAGQDQFNNQKGTHAEGYYTNAIGEGSHTEGRYTNTLNNGEHASGNYNVSNTGSTDADKTLFSVGNGTANDARHNAFEIRQNGDIYLSYNGSDIKLQDLIADIYSKLPTS